MPESKPYKNEQSPLGDSVVKKKNSSLKSVLKFAPVLLLLILVAFKALPGYFSWQWSWQEPIPVTNLSQIKSVREKPIEIPEWQNLEQEEVQIGGNKWSVQIIKKGQDKPVNLLLRPLNDHKSKPEVDWVDIRGIQIWQTDSHEKMKFSIDKNVDVKALFFRAWTETQTWAVVQWYAFPQGGDPYPSSWFWADQIAQLKGERIPWIAVCLQMPMKPFGDLKDIEPEARSLAEAVQSTLLKDAFSQSKT
ncbi:MAG: cyanoexosortase B system-associated protein [Spirulinaceae cyanobacterium]